MLIAYIDDDLDDKELFEQAVKDIDDRIHFIHFTNCQHFIQFIENGSRSVDFAFIELNMPLMSGLICSQSVKSNTGISIVLCSSTISPGAIVLTEEMKVPFFLKPSRISELSAEIKKVIFGQRNAPEAG